MTETTPHQTTPARRSMTTWLAVFVVVASLSWYLSQAFIGFDNTLLGHHAFRQTQTALYTESILDGDGLIGYELPVFGPPWRVPYEFPVYEAIVATVVNGTGIDLVHAGRLVSIGSLLLAALAVFLLLRQLRTPVMQAALIISLILLCPPLQFWSRAFMIETTAVMLSVFWLFLTLRSVERESLWTLAIATIIGVLASGAKATTFLIFLALLTLIVLDWLLRRTRPEQWPAGSLHRALTRQLPMLGFASGIPFISAYAWTKVTDVLKSDNPFTTGLTSSGLSRWNFGTMKQRLDPATWKALWVHMDDKLLGHFAIVTVGLFILAMIFTTTACRRRAAIATVAFVIPLLIFTNLFFVHDYYFTSNGVMAMAAIGFAGAGLFHRGRTMRIAGLLYFVVIAGLLQWGFYSYYRNLQKWNPTDEQIVGEYITAHTEPDAITLIYGYSWNPSIAYYADRNVIMLQKARAPDDPGLQRILARIGDRRIGAVAFCRGMAFDTEHIAALDAHYGLVDVPFEHRSEMNPTGPAKFRVFLVADP